MKLISAVGRNGGWPTKRGLGEATVFRFLKGQFTRKTLRKIEQALELSTCPRRSNSAELAEPKLGSYPRELYEYLEGDYMFVRPAFSDADKVLHLPDDDRVVGSSKRPGFH